MPMTFRKIKDKAFTIVSGTSVVLLAVVLCLILGPMLWRGLQAVVFMGTVEFRRMQMDMHGRGDSAKLNKEIEESKKLQQQIFEKIQKFKQGLDARTLTDQAKQIYSRFGQELRDKDIQGEQFRNLRNLTRTIRDTLISAFESNDEQEIQKLLHEVFKYSNTEELADTSAQAFFELAREYGSLVEEYDMSKREEYADSVKKIEDILFRSDENPGLFGPRPGEPQPALTMLRYGATRWDRAQKLLDEFFWKEKWVQKEQGKPLVKIRISRAEDFADTELAVLFEFVEQNIEEILKPRFTFYRQYFIDPSIPGHYFGGVGPEILGTLLLTCMAMIFVFPLGVISAAYLVECATDNFVVRIIRLCINTLAGVPSIVFGLFGLAFFILYFLPLIGAPSKACMLAASMTLAVLTLPVMIRASEEAIRAVPQTYKEASLGVGASAFRTFISVTLPAALPGILTGTILSLSRVAGETAPILFTGAIAFGPIPKSIFEPTRTLSYGSYDIAVGDRLAMLVPHQQYGMVVTLIVLVLLLNTTAIIIRSRVSRKLRGQ
ncbi:MAG: phosphate ABC transporter permease PstA [Phycisphaerae bacterium]